MEMKLFWLCWTEMTLNKVALNRNFFTLFSLQGSIFKLLFFHFYSIFLLSHFEGFFLLGEKKNACNFYVIGIFVLSSRQTEHVSFDIYFDKYL